MTPDELAATVARLRELAAKATPGPWFARGEGICCAVYQGTPEQKGVLIDLQDPTWSDAEFIAACDPQTVLFLCDAVAERDALRSASDGASAARFGKTYIRPVFPAPADEWDDAEPESEPTEPTT